MASNSSRIDAMETPAVHISAISPRSRCRSAPRSFALALGVARSRTSAPQIQPSFFGQYAVGFGHRVVMNCEVSGELPDRRKLRAGLQRAIDQPRADRIGDLAIGRSR